MISIKDFIGESVNLELLGKKELSGILIEYGKDVLVLFNQNEFCYVPLLHIREIRFLSKEEAGFPVKPDDASAVLPFEKKLALKEVLQAAKASFLEINITGSQPIYGCVTKMMDDYICLFSPVYKTIMIPVCHIKWLVPYSPKSKPFGFNYPKAGVSDFEPTASVFEDQLAVLKGSFIKCNVEGSNSVSGKLIGKEGSFLHLATVKEKLVHLNISHLKSVVPVFIPESSGETNEN